MSKGVAEMRRLCFDVEKVTLFCYNYKKSPWVSLTFNPYAL